jgi:hypothetical protein
MITHLLSSRLHAMRVTVGLGVTPSLQITLLADFTAGREFHPALKTLDSVVMIIIAFILTNASIFFSHISSKGD